MQMEWLFPNRATPLGSSAYYSVRFSPAPVRNDLALILAWQREITSVLTEVSEPGVARIKLQWWREELGRIYSGAARHPLCVALAPVVATKKLPEESFDSIISAVEKRITNPRIADLDDLRQTLGQEMGAGFELLSRCCGISSESGLHETRSAGITCGLVYLIRNLGASLRLGHVDIPATLLEEQGLAREDLTPATPLSSLAGIFRELADAARTPAPRAGDPTPGALPPVVMIRYRILQTLLKEIESTGFDVLNQRIGLTPLRKLWIAWRTQA